MVERLGVSNYTRRQPDLARTAVDVPIVCDQMLYNHYMDQSNLVAYSQHHDVTLTAYSPLARGAVLTDDTLAVIGDQDDKSAAQVAFRWLVQQDNVVAIPKATSRAHIAATATGFDFELSDEEMRQVADAAPGLSTRLYDLDPAVMGINPF
jgi:diketogulonate reductase-like aldo/keto reductase